jgi:RNA polymerase sigma-70 factor (ECF subfamily)
VSGNKENIQTDRYWIDKVLGGDTNAFASIIQNTEGLVTQIVFKMISRAEDRKDIAYPDSGINRNFRPGLHRFRTTPA